ncbi:hypothetical protein BVRB_5g100180 [Beta vulgaris subsp. vulgaris]|nr:hypothetical protein BVRB_5g100180 [Beta vulgaris subsp. vulgaris]
MLELTSLIDSDPAWKFLKGSRSASRRARKTGYKSLKDYSGLFCTSSKGFIMPVSEIEKHGVSTSGRRFSDKAEHVPIKKRRFLIRSPSPPPVAISPCTEETADRTRSQDVSEKLLPLPSSSDINLNQIVDNDNSIGAKKSDKSSDRFSEDDDFSGISILAAAACSSSLGRDCGNTEDGLGNENPSVLKRAHDVSSINLSCTSTEPVQELPSVSTAVNPSHKVVSVSKGMEDASLVADSPTFSGNVSFCKEEEIVRNQGVSSRDERLHWDLNVVVDAWEQPYDDPGAQGIVAHSISQDAEKINHNDNREAEGHDPREIQGTLYAAQNSLLSGGPIVSANQSAGEIKNNHDIDACLSEQPLCSNEKSLSSKCNLNLDVMECMVEEARCRHHEETFKPIDRSVVAVPDQTIQMSASCTIIKAEDVSMKSVNSIDKSIGYQPVMQGSKSNVGVASYELQSFDNPSASDATYDPVSAETHMSLSVSYTSDTLLEVKPNSAVPYNSEKSEIQCCEEDTLIENIDVKMVEPRELAKLAIFDDDSGLPRNVAPDSESQRFLAVGTDAADELQEDYDSQYEDGELRESSGRAWEEYGAVDREAENAEFVPNYREMYTAIPSDYHVSESGQVEDKNSERMGIGAAVSALDCSNDNEVFRKAAEVVGKERGHDEVDQILVHKTELTQGKEPLESSKSFSDMASRGADDDAKKNRMPSHIDGSLDSRIIETRVEPKVFRRGLQSQIEGLVARDDAYREEQFKKMENRFEPGSMRSFERVRYPFQNQGRGRYSGSWDGPSDSRRGFRRHYSPITHGHTKVDDDVAVRRDDHGCFGTQDDVSYSQHLPKGRAGAEGEPCGGFQSRYKGDRKFSPDRAGGFGRGRSFRYGPFVEGRGGRGRYNGPSPDESFQSSLKYRHPLSRRDRSLSPFGVRGQSNMQHSRRKSPSRSRSRSPIIWNSPRRRLGAGSGGNTFPRHRSRSPNFRPEVRMQRLRSPQQQPGFGMDHAGGFRSISRNHGSPPRNRWSSARKDEPGHFREIGYKQRTSALDRSPGRIRLRGDRGSAVDSPRNLKPDGYYRFSDRIPDDVGRGARYEENFEERRKHYDPIRPARRNFDDGVANRLHPDINENFSVANNFRDRDASSFQDRGFRGMGSRIGDVSRRFRGENHSFMHERDGKFNSNGKQFGVDAMESSHNLKCEEQYRPNYTGRFSDVNGGNRGCRYENYEDRRKHYGSTTIMRRSDNEDTEKRSNHDENFKDAPEFSRVTRRFEGRIANLSTRFREEGEPIVCGQGEKLDDNPQLVDVKNSSDNDATKGVGPS